MGHVARTTDHIKPLISTGVAAVPGGELLTVRDLGKLLGISRWTLMRWVEAGTFPRPVDLGGQRTKVWRALDVAEWRRASASESSVDTPARAVVRL